jgi:hypothetical protein
MNFHLRTAECLPPRREQPTLARERSAGYQAGGDGEVGPHLRDKVRAARQVLEGVLTTATDGSQPAGGELAGLLELLGAIDTAQAAAVEMAATVQREGLAERKRSLPLDGLLSFQSRSTYGHRRALCNAAERLPSMPHLRAAFHAGAVGWAEVQAVLAEARVLTVEQRVQLDAGFADLDRLSRFEPDDLVDAVRDEVVRLRPDLDRQRAKRAIEHRFLALQPGLDGSGSGYFELDADAYGVVAEAIDAALAPLSAGPNDISRHAAGEAEDADQRGAEGDGQTPDGDPAFCDPTERRDRARARADALVRLCETFLGANPTEADLHGTTDVAQAATDTAARHLDGATHPPPRPLRRARPSLQAICDIHYLTGHDRAAVAARALIAAIGRPVRLTPETIRRLACDTKLQLVFTDGGEILGTTDPEEEIPVAVRRALWARDQGCRFPGCTMPAHWTDAHHVTFRRHGGPTTVHNLVLLCRRHHTAVHEGGWKLAMEPDGTVTVRYGRHRHTTDPPRQRPLLPHRP